MVVVIALQVNIVVVQMKLQNVKCVCQVFTLMNQDKVLVYHAFPVNTMPKLAQQIAPLAKRIPFQLIKIVKFPAIHVLQAAPLTQEVRNVRRVHRANTLKLY